IDGTANFINNVRHSSVSIALVKDHTQIAGVVYNPYLDELFSACRGGGAFLNGEPISPSNAEWKNALIGFGMAFATRYVSVGSLLFALTLPISAYLLGFPLEMLYLTIFVSAMAFWRHRGNIKKLLNGTENKFGSKK
ncbi:MAG: hypothetical protein HP045_05600, partial [Anaerotignum sp.]|nr:hypothetical protein [Anaerotignum sp.]